MNEPQKTLFRRNKLFINKKIQGVMFLYTLGLLVCTLTALWFRHISFLQKLQTTLADNVLAESVKQYSAFWSIELILLVLYIVCFSFAYILLISHKLLGPLYQISRYFQDLVDNKYDQSKKLSIRSGDELQDLVDNINEYLSRQNK